MFCSKCGCQLDDSATFCSNCGTPIKQNDASGSGQTRMITSDPSNQYQQTGIQTQRSVGGYGTVPTDLKFRILPGFFSVLGCLFAGMYDLGVVLFLTGFLNVIPAVGNVVWLIIDLLAFVFVGKNYNYYKRIHNETGMVFFQIMMDDTLRHF